MTRVVCFGEMLLRLGAPHFERLLQTPTLTATFAGSEANVAISLARFGAPSVYVTRLPANTIGDLAVRTLRAEGVDTAHIRRGGSRMGLYFLEAGAGQRPSTITYDRTPSAFSTLDPAEIDWTRVLDGASWLHVTGITPALGPGPTEALRRAIAAAREAGLTVSFDLNYRAALWPAPLAARVLQQFARGVDLLIASADHVEPLLGIRHAEPGRAAAEQYNCALVAITSRECRSANDNTVTATLWDHRCGELYDAPTYDVEVVDRVGAGDAFAAGLIYALSSGRPAVEALRFAVAAGALKHTIHGDANLVTVSEVERLVNGDSSGRLQR